VSVGSPARGATPRPALFFDRDGVLTEVVGDGRHSVPPIEMQEVAWVAGARVAARRLAAVGFVTIVVTNQPDVARGTVELAVAVEITQYVVDELELCGGYVCPHDNEDACECRKPLPGMLRVAAEDWNLDLGRSWLIGDRWVDVAAAAACGVRSVLLERRYSWSPSGGRTPPPELRPAATRPTVEAAADLIINALRP
jgi:D-glycero-D-manno-heptose 1,7-bisphosphate phosphatase